MTPPLTQQQARRRPRRGLERTGSELRMLVERVRRARAHTAAAEAGEQTHVFVVYSAVAECAVVRSRAVRAAAASVLRVVGGLLPMGEALLGSA